MSLRILAIDTATEACSVAMTVDGRVWSRDRVAGREHTQLLLPMIGEVLADGGVSAAQLDGIACGVGPGSFAGVRIGVGVAKGMALAHDLPVVGVSSLAMLSQQALAERAVTHVAAVIDARMHQVYCGLYRRGVDGRAQAMMAERVCAPGQVPRLVDAGWFGAGSGWGTYAEELHAAFGAGAFPLEPMALPRARDALVLALPDFASGQGVIADSLAPVYLRDHVALTLAEQRVRRG